MSRAWFRAVVVAACCAALLPAPGAGAASPQASQAELLREIARAEDRRDASSGVLQRALSHADAEVRARAALATGRLQDSAGVVALTPLLADRDVRVRREAVFALGQVGHRSARGALERLLADRDPRNSDVVMLAIEALGKLGVPSVSAALTPFLRTGTRPQRMRACESLWRLADTTAAAALIDALGERDPDVRWRVAYALEKLVLPARVVPAVSPLASDPDALVRAHAVRTLGRQKSALATSTLLAALDDADAAVVVNAVRALQLVADGGASGTGERMTRLLSHRDPYVRVTAAGALADSFLWAPATGADSSRLRAALRHGLGDSDFATRGACGRALLVRERLRALEAVRPLFADTIAYVRAAVLDGLRGMDAADLGQQPPRVANALAGAFHVGGHPLERMTAAEVAGQLIGRTHHAALLPLLASFRTGLGDRDVLVSAACAGALADAGDSASVPLLAAAYATRGLDADADARISIRDALRALAGRTFADSVEHAHATGTAPEAREAQDVAREAQDVAREALDAAREAQDVALFAKPSNRRAILHTSAGDMEWEFLRDDAPQTVRNFVTLAGKGYFDSLRVHRVVPDFVIQDGDPTGTGSGGPGYTIRCEYNMRRYEAGMVGMALSGKDTGGSQWFVTLSPQPHLNGRYTIFARVTRGLDAAKRVTQGAIVYRVELVP